MPEPVTYACGCPLVELDGVDGYSVRAYCPLHNQPMVTTIDVQGAESARA